MPHITVQMHAGRTREKKLELTDRLVQALTEVLEVPEEYVSVRILDIPAECWDTQVYPGIMKDPHTLYKKPGYEPE